MNKINGGVGVLTRPNGQDARPTEWVINIVQLLITYPFIRFIRYHASAANSLQA
jgi:hypothetical protein